MLIQENYRFFDPGPGSCLKVLRVETLVAKCPVVFCKNDILLGLLCDAEILEKNLSGKGTPREYNLEYKLGLESG